MRKVLVLLLMLASPALADGLTPAQTQKIIDVLSAQRNNALNAQALAEVSASTVTEELQQAKDKIKELEKKLEDKPKE